LKWEIPFFRHDLGEEEVAAVREVLAGPILTTGEYVERFEGAFAQYLGRRHAVAVTSCTGALHLSLLALGIGPGDEVITTPMTFVATALAIIESGATPVFVDVEPDTGNLDAARIEAAITPRTRAIMPVHLYGLMCDMRAIHDVAARHGLHVIEDAAHCIEGRRDGERPGALADTACFSFYATKNITCGEGGALVTDDDELAARARLLRLHGMTTMAADRYRDGYRHWDVVTPGWKYNMDNIHAAILLPQLARLEANRERREALVARYQAGLDGIAGVSYPVSRPATVHARHLFAAWISGGRRDMVVQALQAAGIGTVVNYRPLTALTWFQERFGFSGREFPVAEKIGAETLSLPLYPHLDPALVDRVVATVEGALRHARSA